LALTTGHTARPQHFYRIMILEEGPDRRPDSPFCMPSSIRTVRARSPCALRLPSAFTTGKPGFDHRLGKGRVPEDLLSNLALGRHRTGFAKKSYQCFFWCYFSSVDILGQSIDSSRRIDRTAGQTDAPCGVPIRRHTDAPLVNGMHSVIPLSAEPAIDNQASVKAPARDDLLAIVHVTINRLTVDRLHVVGEKLCDVFIGAPVKRHAEVIAILALNLSFRSLARKNRSARNQYRLANC